MNRHNTLGCFLAAAVVAWLAWAPASAKAEADTRFAETKTSLEQFLNQGWNIVAAVARDNNRTEYTLHKDREYLVCILRIINRPGGEARSRCFHLN